MFLPGPQLQTGRQSVSLKSKDDFWKTSLRKIKDHSRTYISGVPQLIYSCVDLILLLFIVCIYLLGSWVSPPVCLHSLAYSFFFVFFVFLFVFGVFWGDWEDAVESMWFLLLSWGKKMKGSEILSLDYWTTVPFFFYQNRMCSEKKSIWCF